MITKLTKENFFTQEWVRAFPKASEMFCKWIDEYKKEVEWEKLFNYGSPHYDKQGWHDPKFHDLPIEMQRGILARFFNEKGITRIPPGNPLTDLSELFELLEDRLKPEEPKPTGSYLDGPDRCSSCGSKASNCIC